MIRFVVILLTILVPTAIADPVEDLVAFVEEDIVPDNIGFGDDPVRYLTERVHDCIDLGVIAVGEDCPVNDRVLVARVGPIEIWAVEEIVDLPSEIPIPEIDPPGPL